MNCGGEGAMNTLRELLTEAWYCKRIWGAGEWWSWLKDLNGTAAIAVASAFDKAADRIERYTGREP
jgi:hypothetical protein